MSYPPLTATVLNFIDSLVIKLLCAQEIYQRPAMYAYGCAKLKSQVKGCSVVRFSGYPPRRITGGATLE